MKKQWDKLLLVELIILVLFYVGNIGVHLHKGIYYEMILPAFLSAVVLVLFALKNRQPELRTFTRWALIILVPSLVLLCWSNSFNWLIWKYSNLKILIEIIFAIFLLFSLIPLVMSQLGQVKWLIPRLIAIFWIITELFDEVGNIKHGDKFFHTLITAGLLQAIVAFMLGCLILHTWHFRFNPNLKFKNSKNFSILVCGFLLIFAVWVVCWNAFSYGGNNIWEILFSFHIGRIKISLKSFAEAAEAGILEETMRFLNIFALLYAMRNRKNKAAFAILISAILFGLMHLSNFGWQALAPTLAQVVFTFAAGLLLGTIYLYTGKIWLTMLVHFSMDFLIFIQTGGDQPGQWYGDWQDWISLGIMTIPPILVYLWMLFGKRYKVMRENADRLIEPALEFSEEG